MHAQLPAIDASALVVTLTTVTTNHVTGVTCTSRAAMADFTTDDHARLAILCGMTTKNGANGLHPLAIAFVSFQLLILSHLCIMYYIY